MMTSDIYGRTLHFLCYRYPYKGSSAYGPRLTVSGSREDVQISS